MPRVVSNLFTKAYSMQPLIDVGMIEQMKAELPVYLAKLCKNKEK